MTGFQPIGYEFAAELTFPEPDGPVSAILNISTQIFGIVVTLLISGIQQILGDLIGNVVRNLKQIMNFLSTNASLIVGLRGVPAA